MNIVVVFLGGNNDVLNFVDQSVVESAAAELHARAGINPVVVLQSFSLRTPGRHQTKVIPLGFDLLSAPYRVDRELRLTRIREAAAGVTGAIEWQDPVWDAIREIAGSDAALILSSNESSFTQSARAYELVAFVDIARSFNKPVVIAGLNLDDLISSRARELVAHSLHSANLIGVSDEQSRVAAIRWGIDKNKVRHIPLGLRNFDEFSVLLDIDNRSLPDEYVLADFGELTKVELYQAPLVELLLRILSITGLPVVLITDDGRDEDELFRGKNLDNIYFIGRAENSAAAIAALARRASLILSTSVAPLGFALDSAVPFVGIASDAFSALRVAGALQRIGMEEWLIPSYFLGSDDAQKVLEETWIRRREIKNHLTSAAKSDSLEAQNWWDGVLAGLAGERVTNHAFRQPEVILLADRALNARSEFAHELARRADELHAVEGFEWRERIDELGAIALDVLQAEQRVGEVHAELLNTELRLAEADAGLQATQSLMAKVTEPLFSRTLRPPIVPYSENVLNDLLQTRTLRWTRGLRSLYATIRYGTRDRRIY